jgi:hypothetical protein
MTEGIDVTPRTLRRVVSSVDAQGRSTIVRDETVGNLSASNDFIEFADLWSTPSLPPEQEPDLDAGAEAPRGLDLADPRGTFCRIASYGPDPEGLDLSTMFHTTTTVDYIMILSGEIWAIYQDGSETLLHPGDFLVQRGVAHAWSNRSTAACVMLSVRVGAPDHGMGEGGWRPER